MKVNEDKLQNLLLFSTSLDTIVVPVLSERSQNMIQSFDDLANMMSSEDNALMNILKYSFFLRYLSNN